MVFISLDANDVCYQGGWATRARSNPGVDWIVIQMHQCALSSSTDNGCDVAIRQAWVPLFDKYQVDLVVNGHDHDYKRSFPVRGFTPNLGTSTFAGGTVTNASGTVTLPSTKGQPVNTFTPNVVSAITVTYYHAPTQTAGTPSYSILETFQLVRARADAVSKHGEAERGGHVRPAVALAGSR